MEERLAHFGMLLQPHPLIVCMQWGLFSSQKGRRTKGVFCGCIVFPCSCWGGLRDWVDEVVPLFTQHVLCVCVCLFNSYMMTSCFEQCGGVNMHTCASLSSFFVVVVGCASAR